MRNTRVSGPRLERVVMALGGNALLRRGEQPGGGAEERNLARAVDAVASVAGGRELVVTHGNGPQVGLLANRAAEDGRKAAPLDVLGAETDGMIGYLLEREIRTRLPGKPVVTLLTQITVDPADPAFGRPSKPIGPIYQWDEAMRLADRRGWAIAEDGPGWRRVVPSPRPVRILELEAVKLLLAAGHLVVCGGGGGIPVVLGDDGALEGVEAVVDKDRSSALLAAGLDADVLLLLTDESAIFRDWPERREPIAQISAAALSSFDLPEGSMGPKAEAAATFARETGRRAAIGSLDHAEAVLAGTAGTQVRAN